MDITEKWLGEIGGWQAMKAARMIVAAGKVQVSERSNDLVRGHVGSEKSRLTSGLRIRSKSDVENLCTCMMARRTGQICDHSLAVALASLLPTAPTGAKNAAPSDSPPQSTVPKKAAPATAPGSLSLFLPEILLQPGATAGKSATAFLKLEPGAGETSALAGWLKSRGVPLQNTPLSLPPAELSTLMEAAVDHPRIFLGKPGPGMSHPLIVAGDAIRPLVKLHLVGASASKLQASFQLAESPAPRVLNFEALGGVTWLHHALGGTLHPWKFDPSGEVGELAKELLVNFRPGRDIQRPLRWLPLHLSKLEDFFQIELSNELSNRYKVVTVSSQIRIEIVGNMHKVELRVRSYFQGKEWNIASNCDHFPIEDQQFEGVFYVRNVKQEKDLFDELYAIGFELSGKTAEFEMVGKSEILRFFASTLPKLESVYYVTKSQEWESLSRSLFRVAPMLRDQRDDSHNAGSTPSSGMDWLRMEFSYEATNGFQLSRSEALRLIRSGQNTIKGKDGRQYVLDVDRCQEFEDALGDVPVELTPNGLRLSSIHQSYFLPFASRAALAGMQDTAVDLQDWRQKLGGLGEVLRPYQIEGVAWLAQRMKSGQGALLGDDMGLGKTLQSIALIRWILKSNELGAQALVVCPKSLIPNWYAEFQRFAPDLKVLAIHGPKRHTLLNTIEGYDVLITSYPLISRDLERYQQREFAIGVFDEASFLRNPDTETAGAARALELRTRLALSGTPVENGVRDLWSIFQILIPGYLGNRQSFHERFEKPLQSSGQTSDAAATRLRRLIRPFFLRRTKGEVLKDLPEKIEQVFWCEMSGTQAEMYRRILEEGREEIRNARRRSGQNGARMTMLTVLLRLRQVCCDVGLAGLSDEKLTQLDTSDRSGKWEAVDDRLDEALAGTAKVLIFSQFVTYLKAFRQHLDNRGVAYAYLDGSTTDRAEQVTAFQTDPKKRVFLISLKAGGYGLNLTQADHVFLMDPWWNPAVEAQAIDRAHRFGQNRVVNAYRFVMRGTVEERVLALQDKKRGLISATIEERAPLMEGLTDSDLESLLSD